MGKRVLMFMEEDREALNYRGSPYYIIQYPIRNHAKVNRLRLWVEYRRKEMPGGFYLYMVMDVVADGYAVHPIRGPLFGQKVCVMGVKSKARWAYREASRRAGAYAEEIFKELYPDVEVDWDHGMASNWCGLERRPPLGLWGFLVGVAEYDFPFSVYDEKAKIDL